MMTDYARQERRALADLLLEVGPDEPTLCEGWTTRDLAAHLVVRERRPFTAMLRPGDDVRLAKAAEPFESVVAQIRNPPRWSLISNPLTDELANSGEFFIHHEDVRRARPGWQPRALDDGQQRSLWRALRLMARLSLRKLHLPLRVVAPGRGELTIGDGSPRTTLIGDPGELTMFVSGRQRAARVQVEGGDAEALRTARLSI
jgi:uncharacterized protein (TIGR03085 family)